MFYTDVMREAPEKVVNHGSRIDSINLLKSLGLAPFYPMPAAARVELGAEHKSAVSLMRALNDPDPAARVAAAHALVSGDQLRPSDSEFVPALVRLLADKNDEVRHVAIFCLIRIGPPARAAMPALAGLYWFGIAQDQADALSAMESIDPDDRASVAVFLDAAKSSDVTMRVFASGAMSHVKVDPAGRGIVRALTEALADKAWNVRVQSAYGLELLGPAAKVAVPALKAATGDPDERVRQHAAHALEIIEGKSSEMPPSVL